MKYKLGLDLGSTSLGWAVVELDNNDKILRLVDLGVRIFPDGRDDKTHTPINVDRRNARTMRRRGDRVQIRKKRTLQLIKKYGLNFDINKNPELEDPYVLRVKALGAKLSSAELGRVFFHFALRRGFKSNRKETRGDSGGKLKAATVALQSAIGDGTLAQFQVQNKQYRFANQFDGEKIKDGAFYPTREMYLDEFNRICTAQAVPTQMRQEFHDAIFFQHNLLPAKVGKCIFEPTENRVYKFEPAFQKWRTLQQINQLRFVSNGQTIELTPAQRNLIVDMAVNDIGFVNAKGQLTFAEIKKQLKAAHLIDSTKCKFNLESDSRRAIDADKTAHAFAMVGALDFWRSLDSAQQSDLLAKINDDFMSDDILLDFLSQTYNLSPDFATRVISVSPEEDVASVSLLAINKMLPYLESGLMFDAAATQAGYNHSNVDTPDLPLLPYYGDLPALRPSLAADRDGHYRTMNATVHIAMNQIRAVVNDLIGVYGKPYAINIEMGRDVRSGAKDLSDMIATQNKNKKENDKIADELASIGILHPSREDFQKYKLWERLAKEPQNRRCVYTGKPITSIIELFKSGNFEIEHILPYAQTLDDSLANKTISAVEANRFKGNRTPYDAFTSDNSPYDYNAVWERAQKLPESNQWRFRKDAMEIFNRNGDCIARALNDTRHMSRMAVTYLRHVCENKSKVHGLPGQMTALFRDMWGLNWWKDTADSETYRGHHIHHAIDAFVIACMSSGHLQILSKNATSIENYFGKPSKEKRKQLFVGISRPFDNFDYYDFKMKTEQTIVSYRQSVKNPAGDGTVGQLHEDTAYNLEEFETGTKATLSRRIELPTTAKDKEKFAKKDWQHVNRTTWQMFMIDTGYNNDTPDIGMRFLDWCAAQTPQIKKVRMNKSDVDTLLYVPVFRTKAERNAYNRALADWYVANGIAAGIADKKQKRAQQDVESALLAQYRTAARRAYKWYVGGNNFCADVFEIRNDDTRYPKMRGKWQVAVISNYNAAANAGAPLWRKKHATARRIMRLRINDMVMAEFSQNDSKLPKGLIDAVKHQCAVERTDTVTMMFRVKKINSSGTVYLRPHHVAKEEADTKSWAASAMSLQEHKARKVHISPTGKILK